MNEIHHKQSPIFIIGTERSGTNLLRLILNSHSHIAIPHPPHIMKNFSNLEPLYGNLNSDLHFKRLIKDVVRMVELHPYPWEIKIDRERIFREAAERNLINIFFAIYNQYLESTQKKRWGCKSTFMIYHVALIRRYYPQAKFLYMVRDGRDVAASAKKSIFNRYCVYYTAQLWKKEQQIGISWLDKLSANDIFLLKYEDLLAKPKDMVGSLCSFLDEPFENSMLDFSTTEEAKKSGSISAAWKNTSKPIIRDNTGKFNKELTEKEIALFEAIASRELAHFSYALITPTCVSEEERVKRARYKTSYFFEEFFLMLKVQLEHLFTDKHNSLRFKKYWFMKLTRVIRLIK